MRLIRSFLIAFSTYSRIPVPQVEWTEENRRYAMCFFPLVGAALGLILWGWLALSAAMQTDVLIRGAVAALLPLLVTGGIHMDGYMDTTDALASWAPQEKRLEILKDSHTGAFAVMGCAGYLLLSAALFGEAVTSAGPQLACVFVFSRALSALALNLFRSARPEGMLDDFSRVTQKRLTVISAAIYGAACVAVWGLTGGWLALLCPVTAGICFWYYRHMAYKQFGGVTGDLAGWFLQVTELALTAVIVLGGNLL